MDYSFILVIAIIMLSTKVLGLASEKVNMPQVVGALIAGLLLGPSCFGLIGESDFLVKTAEIGVIILMFTAGLDTDVQELKHTGLSAFIIATIGVIVPFLGGAGCYLLFNGEPDSLRMLKAAFIGVILTATSVSITVETLREMGKLKSRVGTAIMAAAVIDDVLGIIVLTVLTGFTDSTVQPVTIFIRIIAYFICLAIIAIVIRQSLCASARKDLGQSQTHCHIRACILLHSQLCFRALFRHCRHHRRLLCRTYAQRPRRDANLCCKAYKHHELHALLPYFLCIDRHKNRACRA